MTTVADAGAAIGQVEVDSRNIDLAVSPTTTAVPPSETVCALLTTDAQTAIGNLPTPDTSSPTTSTRAYEEAAAAGNDCYNGASGERPCSGGRPSERAKLVPLLATAVDRYRRHHRAYPSTATTLATATAAIRSATDDPVRAPS